MVRRKTNVKGETTFDGKYFGFFIPENELISDCLMAPLKPQFSNSSEALVKGQLIQH